MDVPLSNIKLGSYYFYQGQLNNPSYKNIYYYITIVHVLVIDMLE